MTVYNYNLDLVNMKAYIKFGEILSICSKDIEWKQTSDINQGTNSERNVQKMRSKNTNLYLVNMNAYIKFGEILLICFQDILA